MKLLFLIVLGFVIYLVIKSYSRSQNARSSSSAPRGPEDMVKCAHCGVNLPRSEAILTQGKFYCSREHQQLGQQ